MLKTKIPFPKNVFPQPNFKTWLRALSAMTDYSGFQRKLPTSRFGGVFASAKRRARFQVRDRVEALSCFVTIRRCGIASKRHVCRTFRTQWRVRPIPHRKGVKETAQLGGGFGVAKLRTLRFTPVCTSHVWPWSEQTKGHATNSPPQIAHPPPQLIATTAKKLQRSPKRRCWQCT